jgi:solute carrier family 35, member C2
LASIAEKKRLWWRNAVINLFFIASWYGVVFFPSLSYHSCTYRFFFATILSVYNKWMFAVDHFGFPYPLFVTTLHMFVQFVLAAIIRYGWPKLFKPERSPTRGDYG